MTHRQYRFILTLLKDSPRIYPVWSNPNLLVTNVRQYIYSYIYNDINISFKIGYISE